MIHTRRLFDENSHLFDFTATVLSVDPAEDGNLSVVLDATAFFPEGGGQSPDTGTLGGCSVIDVQERDGVIYHTVKTEAPFLAVGDPVVGHLDREVRLRKMQNHSGEHIISGIVHRLYGYTNVGFHLGCGDVTLDFDGVLTRQQLNAIEDEANRIIAACLPVKAYYPAPEVLATLTYRAKLDLTENVRMVEIGQEEDMMDRCACCAPHVDNTGEIGIIKLLDFIHYKGGVRIHMLCGLDALEDYRRRYTDVALLASRLSVKQSELVTGFDRLAAEIEAQKQTIFELRQTILTMTLSSLPETEGSLCLFEETGDANAMRRLLNQAVPKCKKLCGVFSGDDENGYRYFIGRGDASIDLKQYNKEISAALNAKGGGSSEMLQGRAAAAKTQIEAYFKTFS
ncbi:MAG: alanyl-tRNA editing protein [Clostridia bacterium]|nr:alanyl-tRNA editing protein [Clostridia bacterium]